LLSGKLAGFSWSIFIPESVKKLAAVKGFFRSVLAISGLKIGENFPKIVNTPLQVKGYDVKILHLGL
jgi:hypothetical protein